LFIVIYNFADDEIETIKAHPIRNGLGAARDFFKLRGREHSTAIQAKWIDQLLHVKPDAGSSMGVKAKQH